MAAKGGSVLGAIALIIAIGALGFELYNVYLAPPPLEDEKEIGGTWYKSLGGYSASPDETFVVIDGLTIQFNISTGESVYASFNGLIELTVPLGESGLTRLDIYFSLDGVRLKFPKIQTFYNHDGVYDLFLPASLQYFNSTLSPGAHNITIVLYGDTQSGIYTAYNWVHDCTLFVQTYHP